MRGEECVIRSYTVKSKSAVDMSILNHYKNPYVDVK